MNQILNKNNQELQSEYENVVPHLINLQKVFDILFKQRELRSAIEFDSTETTIVFNEQGKIDFIKPVYRNQAHRIIEECMLSANVCAADFLLDNNGDGLFRNHEDTDSRKT